VLREFGWPEVVFRASKRDLEACRLPADTAGAVLKKKAFPRTEKERAAVRKVEGCSLLNWTDPAYPQTRLQIYDPAVLLYVRGDTQVLNLPSLGNLLAAEGLNGSEKKLYELLSAEEAVPVDDLVERSGLNSSEVLATLFTLEMKGIVRQLPGKPFCKVLL
jgi:predicted Rossmann fold nucleotide-binding protein DprA/Smf involved in DNA uptake